MSAPYSNQDATFDREQLHGPMCPIHNVKTCACCEECGRKKGHAQWCRDREWSPDDEGDLRYHDGSRCYGEPIPFEESTETALAAQWTHIDGVFVD